MVYRFLESGNNGIATGQGRTEVPSYDHAIEKINDDRQVGPALAGTQIRNITNPFLIGSGCGKVPFEQMFANHQTMLGIRGMYKLPL